jgi:hypothetical protein
VLIVLKENESSIKCGDKSLLGIDSANGRMIKIDRHFDPWHCYAYLPKVYFFLKVNKITGSGRFWSNNGKIPKVILMDMILTILTLTAPEEVKLLIHQTGLHQIHQLLLSTIVGGGLLGPQ